MKLIETIDSYLESCESIRTKDSYSKKVKSFYSFLVNEKKINDNTYKQYFKGIGIDEIRQGLDRYIDEQAIRSESAAFNYITIISMYFEHIQGLGIEADIILKSLSIKKGSNSYFYTLKKYIEQNEKLVPRKTSECISEEDALTILGSLNMNINNLVSKADFSNYNVRANNFNKLTRNLMLKIILCVGCRYEVIREIKYKDYDKDSNRIIINNYKIALPETLCKQMKEYDKARKSFGEDSEFLFITQEGEQYSYITVIAYELNLNYGSGGKVLSICKYPIVKMIEADIDKDVIKEFTGCGENIYKSCKAYAEKMNKDNYINSKLSSMTWYNSF